VANGECIECQDREKLGHLVPGKEYGRWDFSVSLKDWKCKERANWLDDID
jgi:hypothetical protein